MPGLQIITTKAGRAALINAEHNGTAPLKIAHIGITAAVFTPNEDMTALPGEIKRIDTISGDTVAPDTIHVTIRDDGTDTYTVRGIGYWLSDGVLLGVYGQPEPILQKSAQSMMLLAADTVFTSIKVASLAFGNANFTNPPATVDRQGVVALATAAETATGTNAARAVTPAGLTPALALKAPLDSPALTGAPTVPTPDQNDNSKQIVNSEYVTRAIRAIPAPFNFTPVQQGTGVGQKANVIKIGWGDNARLRATVDTTDLGNIAFESWILALGYAQGIENAAAHADTAMTAANHAQATANYANLPAGTRMPFAQAAAPTGWTQVNDDSTSNRMLRVVNGAGGAAGGWHSPIENNVVPAHTHGFTTGTVSSGHTHGIGDPGHTHGVSDPGHAHTINAGDAGSGSNLGSGNANKYGPKAGGMTAVTGIGINSAGTGIWTGDISANHTHSGATDNGSSQTNWSPRYIDMIICAKK